MSASGAVHANRRRHVSARSRQYGAAALAVTVLLCFAMALAVAYVHRSLVIDQRTAIHQMRSTQAFEAAEAGMEWMLAALNDNRLVGDDCMPSGDASAVSIRDRMLTRTASDAPFSPVTWLDHGVDLPLQVACESVGGGWHCACPSSGTATLVSSPGATASFRVGLAAGDGRGLVKVVSLGCSGIGAACSTVVANESTARITASVGLLQGLASAPAAPIVARQDVLGDSAPWLARNDDASTGGVAVQAGGELRADRATLEGPTGGAVVDAVMTHDASLAGQTPPRFFKSYFGLDEKRWSDQSAVQHIRCGTDCSATIADAIATGGRNQLIAIDGDLTLVTPVVLGSEARPVVIVAKGAVHLAARIEIHGLLYGASVHAAAGSGSGSVVRGALISAGDIAIDDASTFIADAALLERLRVTTGTFTRVSGSWRDF